MIFHKPFRRVVGVALMIGGLSCSNLQDRPAGSGVPMYNLHIALHDGFKEHHVTISVDGRSVYDKSGVTTNLAISRADAFDLTVSLRTVRIDVSVQPGSRKGSTTVDVASNPFVAVSLGADGQVLFQPSAQPFRYM